MNDTVSLRDTINQRISPLRLPSLWSKFLSILPKEQFIMQVYGSAGSGKSTFAMKFADVLANYADVLYCNFEENLKGGTIQKKARLAKVSRISKIFFLPDDLISEDFDENYYIVCKLLESGKFRYCIIDSVGEIVSNVAEEKKLLGLKKKYPQVSFIYLFHVEKVHKYYLGSSKSIHRVDIVVEIEEGKARIRKNRYQIGSKAPDELSIFK